MNLGRTPQRVHYLLAAFIGVPSPVVFTTGVWFHETARYAVFLLNGVALLVLVATGGYMFMQPIAARRRRTACLRKAQDVAP